MASKDDKKDEKMEEAMDSIFHSGPKSKDYLNLGGASRAGGPQVDNKAKAKADAKAKKSSKVKQDVPQIGALGAFAALSGGMIGGVSMAATKDEPKVQTVDETKPHPYKKQQSVLSGVGEAEIDENRRKFSSIKSQEDEEEDDAPMVDIRVRTGAPSHWDSDEGHHFQSSYAHAHHVMPRMRRKKKASISSDDGQLSDEESGARKKSGKRRSSKKEIEHLPTIEDESKPSMFGIGSATEQDEESEVESKFQNLKKDAGDIGKSKKTSDAKKSVMFSVGQTEDSEVEDKKDYGQGSENEDGEPKQRKRKRSKKAIGLEDRRRLGSMVKMDEYAKMVVDDDEEDYLEDRDVDEMAAHRLDSMAGHRHKISRDLSHPDKLRIRRKKKHRHTDQTDDGHSDAEQKFVAKMYGMDPEKPHYDHTPHDIFVQLSELNEEHTFWEEKSRWIKYEECKEEGAERWGRPHLSSLSFHSLINLRLSLEKAVIILDYDQAKDFTNIAFKISEEVVNEGFVTDDQLKVDLLRLLLIRHKFVDSLVARGVQPGGKLDGLKRSFSKASMADMEKLSESQRANNLSPDSISQRKYARPTRKRKNDYARAASTQPYSDQNNQDEINGNPFHINTENIHSGTHLQVPVVADLSSHSSARTWIRSVSYPAQSGNNVVHFENESEPLIKTLNPMGHHSTQSASANDMGKAKTAVGLDELGNGKDGMNNGTNHFGADLEAGGIATFANLYQTGQNVQKAVIMNRLKDGTEGTLTLVGYWEYISEPLCVFMRLAEGLVLPNTMEVPIPVRFIFLLLTPDTLMSASSIDPHEVGRSFSTMMSNPEFHNEAYQFTEKRRLLTAINEFLDSSVVLPSGNWESKNLISMEEIKNLRKNKEAMKEKAEELKQPVSDDKAALLKEEEAKEKEEDDGEYDPMKFRGPVHRNLFRGVINDLKTRYPWYLSDIKDGLNGQCVAATIFIYFAALSGAVAFGGLMGGETRGQIGVPETMITSAVSGLLYALFAGQPLIITGLTGPILLYDTALFGLATSLGIDFLQWRVWIGVWLSVIALGVAAFQGSVLVRYFTKFTKDIFASLVSLLFIFSALKKLHKVWKLHPLYPKEYYIDPLIHQNLTLGWKLGIEDIYDEQKYNETATERVLAFSKDFNVNSSSISTVCTSHCKSYPQHCGLPSDYTTTALSIVDDESAIENEPNTALLSFILMFGTFMIAYGLKQFRNSHYFGRTLRRALGDFGVPIGIVFMVLVDYLAGDTYTKKLTVPFGLQTTIEGRGWFINPFVSNLTGEQLQAWVPFMSILPAFLLFLVLFIETEICELIMLEKSKRKGGGLHWDIVLLCFLNTLGGFFGGPWICAATVRGVAHVGALTVMSTNHAPGEAPHIVEVKDQRVSFAAISLLLGVSVVLADALQQVPFAVLYGVFLYMGVSGIAGIQLFDRLFLMFMPVKHHPRVGYTRRVKTWKMHLFTIIQFGGLGILWGVKESPAALSFPFFVISMLGLRWSLKFLFTEKELEHLDGPNAGKAVADENDEPDFYEEGIGG